MQIVKSVYLLTEELPLDEKYGLKSQIQRCAVSVPSNIAEGSGRGTVKDFIYFLNVSLSSSYELEIQLILLNDLYGIKANELIDNINEVQRMIIGFKRSLNAEQPVNNTE